MYQLSDSITRKFTGIEICDDYEIQTPDGQIDISKVMKTVKYDVQRLVLDNGMSIECADDHIVISHTGEEVFVKDLIAGDRILTENGEGIVFECLPLGYEEEMYDVEVNSEDHLYYSNGIVSHNTTTAAAILLWHAIFKYKYDIAIVAQQRGQAVEILDRIRDMYENLPWWMQVGVFSWNRGSIKLGNKSRIYTAAATAGGLRGKSCHLLFLDEFAWVQQDIEFYTATYPVVSSGSNSKIIIASTPNGMNLFYKLQTEAERGDNAYAADQAHQYEHPMRDEKWKEEQLKNMSPRQFSQEFETNFLGSSSTLLSASALERLTFQPPIGDYGGNRDFKIYELPDKTKQYCLTVDVSEGVGRDYSVISIIDVTTTPYKQVVMMRSNIMAPLLLADLINRVGHDYNDAYVLIESNSYGKQVCDALWDDYEYENMMLSRAGSNDTKLMGEFASKITPGIKTTKTTKKLGCTTLKGLIESNQLIINDYDTIQELNSFSMQGTSYAAEKGKTDDIVMSLVIFSWFSSQPYFNDTFDINTRDLIRANILQNSEYEEAFGFMDDGIDEFGDSESLFRSFL